MHKKITLAALAFAIIAPASIAFAEESQPTTTSGQVKEARKVSQEQNGQATESRREQIRQVIQNPQQAKRLEFQDRKEKMELQQCKNIETKISTRTNRYERNGEMLQKVYGNMQTRLARLLARLKEAGADTAQLETDLATLDTKIEKLKTDQSDFIATLQESQSFVCGKSEGEFKGKLEQARKVPEIIKADREDIRNFFQTTIKADLQVIREKLALQKETAETEDEAEKTVAPVAPAVQPAPAPTVTPAQ